eukprot:14285683-Alexandrium_andersonii.AAC.1
MFAERPSGGGGGAAGAVTAGSAGAGARRVEQPRHSLAVGLWCGKPHDTHFHATGAPGRKSGSGEEDHFLPFPLPFCSRLRGRRRSPLPLPDLPEGRSPRAGPGSSPRE